MFFDHPAPPEFPDCTVKWEHPSHILRPMQKVC
jgi:hypothetical protein